MTNRWYQFRLRTRFWLIIAVSALLAANLWQHNPHLLGHISPEDDFLGFWVAGYDLGWPATYRHQPLMPNSEVFARIKIGGLAINVVTAVLILAAIIVLFELPARLFSKQTNETGEKVTAAKSG